MKKVGIDARLYAKTGVGVYIRNLLHYLQKYPLHDMDFYVYLMDDQYDTIKLSSDRFVTRRANFQWHSIAEQTSFLSLLNEDELDLMHFTYFSFPVRYPRKFIATVHDTILLDHKTGKASTRNFLLYELKHRVFRYVFQKQLMNAEKIITPSQTTKTNILELFGEKYASKMLSLYEGVSYELMDTPEKPPQYADSFGHFFIYVGNFYPHKNVERLVEAFAQLKGNMKLLLIGPEDYFSQRIQNKIHRLGQTQRIVMLSDLTPAELVYCYKHAHALIHPSEAEGFCLPLLEAAYFDLPIIASGIDIFKEILGNQFVAFNPYVVDDIRQKIEHFIRAPAPHSYASILPKHSFEAMTEAILAIYRKLA